MVSPGNLDISLVEPSEIVSTTHRGYSPNEGKVSVFYRIYFHLYIENISVNSGYFLYTNENIFYKTQKLFPFIEFIFVCI